MKNIVPNEIIISKIYLIRGIKVILDRDLAELYEVETRVLKQAVKRNIKRFPDDFMLELTREEINRISQNVTSSGIKYSKTVHAFTEQGVAMLSGILNSERAIAVNIQIMRTFFKLREMLLTHKELAKKMEKMEDKYDQRFQIVFETLEQLLNTKDIPKRKIGF